MSLYGLPGDWRELKPGTGHTCNYGCYSEEGIPCGEPATQRQQGETDSFGAEYEYYCDKHAEVVKKEDQDAPPMTGCCDWCKKGPLELRHARDYDEGFNGPVYEVCSACIQKQERDAQDELDGYQEDYDNHGQYDD